MATAEELLAVLSQDEEVLTVNMSKRTIVLPASLTVMGVESDDDVKRLHFSIPRYYGDVDLSEFVIRVNYTNASNAKDAGDVYDVVDKAVSDDGSTITFSWLVDRHAFVTEGDVTFSICLKKYNDAGEVVNEWNTTTAQLPVLKGLETSKAVVGKNTTVLDQVLFRLYAVEAASGIGQDGYYTVVKMEESDEGVVFTLRDRYGNVEANITHGRTPQKGIDYLTEEDKNEFVELVMNALPVAEGVEY